MQLVSKLFCWQLIAQFNQTLVKCVSAQCHDDTFAASCHSYVLDILDSVLLLMVHHQNACRTCNALSSIRLLSTKAILSNLNQIKRPFSLNACIWSLWQALLTVVVLSINLSKFFFIATRPFVMHNTFILSSILICLFKSIHTSFSIHRSCLALGQNVSSLFLDDY